jgi:hypothetical protein
MGWVAASLSSCDHNRVCIGKPGWPSAAIRPIALISGFSSPIGIAVSKGKLRPSGSAPLQVRTYRLRSRFTNRNGHGFRNREGIEEAYSFRDNKLPFELNYKKLGTVLSATSPTAYGIGFRRSRLSVE